MRRNETQTHRRCRACGGWGRSVALRDYHHPMDCSGCGGAGLVLRSAATDDDEPERIGDFADDFGRDEGFLSVTLSPVVQHEPAPALLAVRGAAIDAAERRHELAWAAGRFALVALAASALVALGALLGALR